eukprot:1589082-Rhodomonas_salina.3
MTHPIPRACHKLHGQRQYEMLHGNSKGTRLLDIARYLLAVDIARVPLHEQKLRIAGISIADEIEENRDRGPEAVEAGVGRRLTELVAPYARSVPDSASLAHRERVPELVLPYPGVSSTDGGTSCLGWQDTSERETCTESCRVTTGWGSTGQCMHPETQIQQFPKFVPAGWFPVFDFAL